MLTSAVLFDFYGTLAAAFEAGTAWEDVIAARGYHLDAEIRRLYSADALDGLDHSEHSHSREAYTAWERARLRDMVLACGVGPDDADALVDDLQDVWTTWKVQPYAETRDVLAKVRASGATVVICSNWDWDLDVVVEEAGLTDLVDAMVTSARAGARKPHPRIFEEALAVGGVGPGEALMVGDTWAADVEGALRVGIPAVHVHRPDDDRPAPPLVPGVTRLPDLRGIPDLL